MHPRENVVWLYGGGSLEKRKTYGAIDGLRTIAAIGIVCTFQIYYPSEMYNLDGAEKK